jgi:hypothetical protein
MIVPRQPRCEPGLSMSLSTELEMRIYTQIASYRCRELETDFDRVCASPSQSSWQHINRRGDRVNDSEQFLIVGPPNIILDLIEKFKEHQEIDVVKVSGRPDAPERIVARMSEKRANELRSSLGPGVLVERDERLGPY